MKLQYPQVFFIKKRSATVGRSLIWSCSLDDDDEQDVNFNTQLNSSRKIPCLLCSPIVVSISRERFHHHHLHNHHAGQSPFIWRAGTHHVIHKLLHVFISFFLNVLLNRPGLFNSFFYSMMKWWWMDAVSHSPPCVCGSTELITEWFTIRDLIWKRYIFKSPPIGFWFFPLLSLFFFQVWMAICCICAYNVCESSRD